MGQPKHARLAPSSGSQWVNCHGSVQMQESLPEPEETEESREGTASHDVCSDVLNSYMLGGSVLLPSDFIGKISENGVVITEEMTESAETYVNHVLKIIQTHGLLRELYIEKPVVFNQNQWGTPDSWVYASKIKTVFIFDYKYGHRFVDVYENWQMINYLKAILKDVIDDTDIKFVFTIVQPREYRNGGPVRTWHGKVSSLRTFFNMIDSAEAEVLGPDPELSTGPHCQYCTALAVCPAAQHAAYNGVDVTESYGGINLPLSALGTELNILNRAHSAITDRIAGLEQQALALIKQGQTVPGYTTKTGYSNRKWNKPIPEVFALGDLAKIDLRKEQQPCTPTQAISKGVDESVISAYSERVVTGIKLIKDDKNEAAKIFTNN